MDKNIDKRIQETMENLRKNNMEPFYCETIQEAQNLVKTLINKGDVISSGGSATLKETGILDIIRGDDYSYLDRTRDGITRAEIEQVYRATYNADVYFTSSNAITKTGYLYNVDGNSNRVSAILYGPKSVVVVAGFNKIVDNLEKAIERVKTVAAPQNTVRLNCNTYCAVNGHCVSLDIPNSHMSDGCHSDGRICCNYVVCGQQRHVNRIKVIIIGEKLGY